MTRIGAFAAGVAILICGCSAVIADPNAGGIDDIAIGTDSQGLPVLEFPDGLEYSKVQTKVVWSGTGDRLRPGDRILLDMYSVSLDSGVVLLDTYSDLPNYYILAPEIVGQELYDALVDEKVGVRLLHVSPPVEGYEGHGAVVLLVDVLPAESQGETQPLREDLPSVEIDASGQPIVIVDPDLPKPVGLQVATLLLGSGAQVKPGSKIKFNYYAVSYDTGEIFESSWDDGEGPDEKQVGVGELVLGLDQGLIDQTEGSRVLLVVPPDMAYGGSDLPHADDTLVFVIDLLAVRPPN